ncbi:MAG: hypothetical protein K2H47_05685 [Muribaculaceae bacterium]|nr:hypothetical protein [Muribaculaceae bacterium]
MQQFLLNLCAISVTSVSMAATIALNSVPDTVSHAFQSSGTCYTESAIGYNRTFIIEEGSGAWCGFCPSGIVFMETIKDNYPDIIRVVVHYNDVMQVTSATPLLQLFTEYPQLYVNRDLSIIPSKANAYETFEAYYNEKRFTMALMEVTNISIEDIYDDRMHFKAKARFAVDLNNDDSHYSMAFSITENGIGPYIQTNYYAGNRYGAMGGWERKGSAVPTVYEDVLRVYAEDSENNFPTQIKAEEEYEFETTIPLSDIQSEIFLLNAMIIDNTTGEIVNAKQVSVTKSAVETISDNNIEIVAEEYYNFNGIRIDKPLQGIFVKRTVFSDGHEYYSKVFINN